MVEAKNVLSSLCLQTHDIDWEKQVTDGIRLDGRITAFTDLYKKQKQAIWFPEEINVGLDLVDYKAMTEKEKTTSSMRLVGYFITSELLVQKYSWWIILPIYYGSSC